MEYFPNVEEEEEEDDDDDDEGVSKPEATVSDGQYWRHSPSSLITSLLSSPRQHENRHIHPHHSVLLVMVGVVY